MRPHACGLAEEAHELLGPISKPDGEATQWALLRLLDALLAPLQPVEDLVRDDGDRPGYSQALDVDQAPAFLLRWLGQLKGVRVTLGNTDDPAWVELARDEVRQAAGYRRGGPQAMILAGQRTLTGAKSVVLYEQDGSAYRIRAVVRDQQCPDPGATLAALMTQKPATLLLTLDVIVGWTINEMETYFDGDTISIAEGSALNIERFEHKDLGGVPLLPSTTTYPSTTLYPT